MNFKITYPDSYTGLIEQFKTLISEHHEYLFDCCKNSINPKTVYENFHKLLREDLYLKELNEQLNRLVSTAVYDGMIVEMTKEEYEQWRRCNEN